MNEKRLLEITSTISMLDGPLVILGYLSSLSESDMYLFLKIVKGSKYRDINFYEAVKLFSYDYLNGKQVEKNNFDIEKIGYMEEKYENYLMDSGFADDYLGQYVMEDDAFKASEHKR